MILYLIIKNLFVYILLTNKLKVLQFLLCWIEHGSRPSGYTFAALQHCTVLTEKDICIHTDSKPYLWAIATYKPTS